MSEPKQDAPIVGRDADAARGPQGTKGEGLAEDLNATTSEAAGAATTRPASDGGTDFDIVFDPEQPDD